MPEKTATAQAKADFLETLEKQEEVIKTKDFLKNYDLWNKKDTREIKNIEKLLTAFAY